MSAEALGGAPADGEGGAKGQYPCQYDCVVVPTRLLHNGKTRDQSEEDEDGAAGKGRSAYGEDGWGAGRLCHRIRGGQMSPIWGIVSRVANGSEMGLLSEVVGSVGTASHSWT